MLRVRDGRRRKPVPSLAVESLENRVVLSAGAAYVEIQYLRAITHLNTLLQGRVNRIQSTLTRRVARVEAQYEGALGRSAARLGSAGPAVAR